MSGSPISSMSCISFIWLRVPPVRVRQGHNFRPRPLFGDGDSPAWEGCHECLTLAVKRAWPCDGNRHAAFWNDGCFLAYSDTDAPVSTEDDDVDGTTTCADG
ncbi:hypothetical protein D1007_42702 [Hordeum vulgare]|nr:hypothetical protein D1007_42702 [Hordeum vulgare]